MGFIPSSWQIHKFMSFHPLLESLTPNELNTAFRIGLITAKNERKRVRVELLLKFFFSAFRLNFYSIFTQPLFFCFSFL